MLYIKDLHVEVGGKKILKGFTLQVRAGEIHALMGPNGAGKSTLAKTVIGDPSCEVTRGVIEFEGVNIVELEPEERARLGIFMSFQHPLEIPGVTNAQFLHAAYQGCRGTISKDAFTPLLRKKMEEMNLPVEFEERSLNEGFSGGEKKRNEILQMALLEPKLSLLDEIDSGLDIDAIRMVANGVQRIVTGDKALILITHYQRLLEYIPPNFVHVVVDGAIVQSGNFDLAVTLEKQGYHVY